MTPSSIRGVCKTARPEPMEDDITVSDAGGTEWSVPVSTYIERGYEPPLDQIPVCGGAEPAGGGDSVANIEGT